MIKKKFAILVLSSDRYSDLWKPFFKNFFNKINTDNFKIYLASNKKSFNFKNVNNIKSGKDIDWSTSYLKILNKIDEQILFVILEDLFPKTIIDEKKIIKIFNLMKKKKYNHIKYWPKPIGDIYINNYLKKYTPGAPYRVTVCGFWNKDTLKKILIPGESPWDFEKNGSYRSKYINDFYSLQSNLFEFVNLIEKGYWIPNSLKWLMQQNITFNVRARKKLSGIYLLNSNIKKIIFSIILFIPWKTRLKIVSFIKNFLISY
tara:strand:+ start:353 stop:1132 length:780 start_codon:yes stop_codon:yes gene_type:complete